MAVMKKYYLISDWSHVVETIIKISKLTKFYGKTLGVSDLDLEIKRGETFGFLGPNGAGKTTTIRMILDFIRPTSGNAMVFGQSTSSNSVAIKKRVGYLPGELEFYKKMKGSEILHYFSNLRSGVDWDHVESLAKRLDYDMNKPVRSLSSGNKHKLGLIQAFMHKPDLLILDEPTSGLDPLMQQEFYKMVNDFRDEGGTAFISSHILPEVEKICDRVGFIRKGKLIDVQNVNDLKVKMVREIEITVEGVFDVNDLNSLDGVSGVKKENGLIKCKVSGSMDKLIKTAAKYNVKDMVCREPNLEDIFFTYYGSDENVS